VKRIRTKICALVMACAMAMTGCSSSITGVTLELPDTMEKGSTSMATPEYAYSGATPEQAEIDKKVEALKLSYSSSDPGVVMVDEHGNLVAVSAGTAEVTLSSENGKIYDSGIITVVVTPTGISMPDTVTLSMGTNINASVEATVVPEDATDVVIEYVSSDEAIATVDNTGYITAVAAGEADITASVVDTGLAATCHVIVTPAIESLDISKSSMTMKPGATNTLSVTVSPEDANISGMTWTSSDEAVATVDQEGNVTAVADGTATITATIGETTATCDVTVNSKSSSNNGGSAGNSSGSSGSNSNSNSTGSSSGSGNNSSSAPAATSTAYGAIPFSLAAGTQEWWHIDSTDDAYWATLENINAYRAAVGAAPLSVDSGLSQIAYTRTLDMVRAGTMSHDGYQTPEIIAQNYNSAQSVVDAWAASPGHYAAMTDPGYTVCGIACEFEEGGATYWCVTFG
jgi:uncharacterized protein YjdB/putative hemolysin